jgi:hypothetical protein
MPQPNFAQHPQERCISVDVDGMTISVDRELESHGDLLQKLF